MIKLGVNIDHVATLRQARGTLYPSVLEAAMQAIAGGADQITVHLREDRRHIQDADVLQLKECLPVPLNLEMAATASMLEFAAQLKPAIVTLVPEKRAELTTEGGLDVQANFASLKLATQSLQSQGIEASLFVDPEPAELKAAREMQIQVVELHTGAYCDALSADLQVEELERLQKASAVSQQLGMRTVAGHGINYNNIQTLVANLSEVVEYNIGHSIIARAVFTGIKSAVEEMKAQLN